MRCPPSVVKRDYMCDKSSHGQKQRGATSSAAVNSFSSGLAAPSHETYADYSCDDEGDDDDKGRINFSVALQGHKDYKDT